MSRAAPHLLILEPDPRGHPLEWIEHVLRYLERQKVPFICSVLVSADLVKALAPWQERKADRLLDVRLIALAPEEEQPCHSTSLVVGALARWRLMRRHLERSGASHGLFLCIDLLSLPLALGLGFGGRRVSGILFRPSVHYPELGGYRPSLKERIRDLRKHALYRLMLRHRALESVFSLDPYFAAYAQARYGRGDKVKALPDPAFPREAAAAAHRALAQALPEERVKLALFGVLTERKGVLALLDALRRLPPEAAARAAVVIAGRVDPPIREAVRQRLALLAAERPQLWLHLEDRHLASGEITALVERCDLVLAPYQRFVGSSGVMLWAAREGKPILTQDYGLLGHLVREYKLGMAVDTTDPDAFAEAIQRAVCNTPMSFSDSCGIAKFVSSRGPDQFASALVMSMLSKRQRSVEFERQSEPVRR